MFGFAFAGITSWTFRNFVVPDWAAPFRFVLDLFLVPGLVVSIAAAGNFHTYEAGPAVMGNFIFYSVVTYICAVLWQKRSRRKLKS